MQRAQTRRGQTIVIAALSTIILFAFLAMVIDWGRMFFTRQKLRNHCDATAAAGALDLPNAATAKSNATEYYARNVKLTINDVKWQNDSGNTSHYKIGIDDVYVTTPYSDTAITNAGISPSNAIEVKSYRTLKHYIGSILGVSSATVSARSVGIAKLGISSGMVVLDPTQCGALSGKGNGGVNVKGTVQVNSNCGTAATLGGNGSVTATQINVTGGYKTGGNGIFSPTPNTGVPPIADPYANLPVPDRTGMTTYPAVNLSSDANMTISPGIYPSINMSGNGNLTLLPGIYVIAGGGIKIAGNGNLIGNGIMIYNTSDGSGSYKNANIDMSGNGSMNLTPPTSGVYNNMLIFQDRNDPQGMRITGNGSITSTAGDLYLKAANLDISGNGGTLNSNVVVDTLTLEGNGDLSVSPNSPLPGGSTGVSLFE